MYACGCMCDFSLTNEERAAVGLPPLYANRHLIIAAQVCLFSFGFHLSQYLRLLNLRIICNFNLKKKGTCNRHGDKWLFFALLAERHRSFSTHGHCWLCAARWRRERCIGILYTSTRLICSFCFLFFFFKKKTKLIFFKKNK